VLSIGAISLGIGFLSRVSILPYTDYPPALKVPAWAGGGSGPRHTMSIFYQSYGDAKGYTTPDLNKKHVRRFDEEVWVPASMTSDMRCLEIGCGTGHFLSYLRHKGVTDFLGIDLDPALADVVPTDVRDRFRVADVREFLASAEEKRPFDRILMFDVFEHFTAEDGLALLTDLMPILAADGAIVLKMPNAASPWGQQFQNGDLTHLTAYTPDSIRQMAVAAGLRCVSCHPHKLGSPGRRRTDRLVQALMNRLLATPPEIWEGNFYAVLQRP